MQIMRDLVEDAIGIVTAVVLIDLLFFGTLLPVDPVLERLLQATIY